MLAVPHSGSRNESSGRGSYARESSRSTSGEYDRSRMLDGGVGCLGQVGSGLNVAQLYGLAQGVEERGDFGSAFRATAVVILAPNDRSPQSTFGPYHLR